MLPLGRAHVPRGADGYGVPPRNVHVIPDLDAAVQVIDGFDQRTARTALPLNLKSKRTSPASKSTNAASLKPDTPPRVVDDQYATADGPKTGSSAGLEKP